MSKHPPRFALNFFRWYCDPDYAEDIEGDLLERFDKRTNEGRHAPLLFVKDVLRLFRPGIIKSFGGTRKLNYYGMIKHNFKIGYRNLLRNKSNSLINIGGLAIGLSIATLISLWVYDEVMFDTGYENYDEIVQVLQHQDINGETLTQYAIPFPLGNELETNYGNDFQQVVMSSWFGDYVLSYGETFLTKEGGFMDAGAPHMLSLTMLKGTRNGLEDPSSILLSESTAKALFGDADPINKVVKIYNEEEVIVTGIYEDQQASSTFSKLSFIAPWELYVATQEWVQDARDRNLWDENSFQLFAQLSETANIDEVEAKIKKVKYDHLPEKYKVYNSQIILHPMKDWHLRSAWKNGHKQGGPILYVWLFGAIGVFVLLLACINFMNLSTAHAVGRAKEVGVRKSIGSIRVQLITQFLSESVLVALLAFAVALLLVSIALPFFNELASKQMTIPWQLPQFWLTSIGFVFVTGLLAGSYPALYLSSFRPVQVLKGTFKTSLSATILRKGLVVFQFIVSIILIVGTIVVQQQISHTTNRPIGYEDEGAIMIEMTTQRHYDTFGVVRNELRDKNAVTDVALSSSPLTEVWNERDGFGWEGKNPEFTPLFPVMWVSHDYGKAIGWEIVEGRDFSINFSTDSMALIVNESGVKYMGIKDPVGKVVKWLGKDFRIIGVVKDVLIESPFAPVRQALYTIDPHEMSNWTILKLNPNQGLKESVAAIEEVYNKQVPDAPFEFDFVSDEHARKFESIKRIGNLSSIFAVLAIIISCLGLFGLASFMAEQRTKEIGIRKVLGASVQSLWKLLSKEFVVLVAISCLVAVPIASFSLNNWLDNYPYRTELHWWIFIASCGGALFISLLTVSFQSIKAATANPVKAMRSE